MISMTATPCTKFHLIEAINSFSKASQVQDTKLMNFAAKELNEALDTLEFSSEPEAPAEEPQA